ncbi:MAG: glycerate kinase [Erysipelotrichales bacterium]|nr:glycerate kinase [Erysipelotrichales bacterium]
MNQKLRIHAEKAVYTAINEVLPEGAVRRALAGRSFPGRVYLIAVGKAASRMISAALNTVPVIPEDCIAVSKYGHFEDAEKTVRCYEAGHPVPDENSILATEEILCVTESLREDDTVIFLLSGGGSALFEKPLIPLAELQDITKQLLACGADITEINTIRKRLSAVKGGKFAEHCFPAHVEAVILSDILGDPADMIASGPVSPDRSTCKDAVRIAEKYSLKMSDQAWECLKTETPKSLSNVNIQIVGSVRELCKAAASACRMMGYEPVYLTDLVSCEAREAGRFMASILRSHSGDGKKLAFLAGGEPVVHLTGNGLGGRNQELALAACEGLRGVSNAAIISAGSDGTDGPTDAAGGYADGDTYDELAKAGMNLYSVLENNDAYHALKAVGNLIITGPTGTNVNDICIGLIDAE